MLADVLIKNVNGSKMSKFLNIIFDNSENQVWQGNVRIITK